MLLPSMRRLMFAAVLVAAAMPNAKALAGPIGQTGTFSQTRVTGYYSGSGGEFTLYGGTVPSNASYGAPSKNIPDAANIALPPSFQTFCMETGENAAPLNYFVISSAAVQGGTTSSDRISKGTAWLYSQFAQGTLNVPKVSAGSNAPGDYFSAGTPARSVEATSLQKALWWLEGEDGFANKTLATLMGNPYFAAAVNHFGSQAAAIADAAVGEYNVYVLNNFLTPEARDLWINSGTFTRNARAQDFLYYYVPPPPRRVPDGGATVALLGGVMLGLGVLRRRFGARR